MAFGWADDSYYQNGLGAGDGYRVSLRADGSIGLYHHTGGNTDGIQLARLATPAFGVGDWVSLRIDVEGSAITISRVDSGGTVQVRGPAPAGGYFHLGRDSPDGAGRFRLLRVQNR